MDDLICPAISPVKPVGYDHIHTAGSQKSIKGHCLLLSVDQSHVGEALSKYQNITACKNIYVVLCGTMTSAQKSIVKRQAEMDAYLFMDLLTWFIKESSQSVQ